MSNIKDKPLILAVETSSRKGSVAIALNKKTLAEKVFSAPLSHSAEIFPAIRGLLEKFNLNPCQIEHIYISGGPGSFTGLRIATTIAKIMQLAQSAKIVTVDTLDVVAANVVNLIPEYALPASEDKLPDIDGDRIAAVLDAKRGQFFIAVYERDTDDEQNAAVLWTPYGGRSIWRKVLPDSLITPSQFLERFACKDKPVWLLGDGLLYYKDRFEAGGVNFFHEKYWSPHAGKVLLLGRYMASKGQFTDALSLVPNYLRKPDITIKSR
jgi:tRNA threonylcarbamoyladenosine biosynthesis protein TsaB